MKIEVDIDPAVVLATIDTATLLTELRGRDDAVANMLHRTSTVKARENNAAFMEDYGDMLKTLLDELYSLHYMRPLPDALREAARQMEPGRTRFMT